VTISTVDKQASAGTPSGRVCPRCRRREEEAGELGAISRCPDDGYALVQTEQLARAEAAEDDVAIGTVYRARQEAMERDVAIKILRSDRALDVNAKARFAREARALSRLGSAHTVTVFDFGEIHQESSDELAGGGASLYLAMELLEGEPLGARLKSRGRLDVDEALKIARQALVSLAEAHDKGIIHRDLKPDNLFLTCAPGPEATALCKVLDFGIAKIRTENAAVDPLETQAGTVFGTPRYMSPEQAQGRELDPRSDLYALGVILYHMLVGRPPFIDEDAVVVMARHIKTIPVSPDVAAPDAQIGEAVSALVMRALAKNPDDRPSSALAFIAALDEAQGERSRLLHDAASNDVDAVVRDDLATSLTPGDASWRRRARVAKIAAAVTAGTAILGFIALRALGTTRDPVPLARAAIARLVANRLPVVPPSRAASQSARAASTPPEAAPAPSSSASVQRKAKPSSAARPVSSSPRKSGYKLFDH